MISQTQTSLPITVEIFISYSQKDREYMEELKKHLRLFERQGLVSNWADTDIQSGDKWSPKIKKQLETANIILFLMSPDFVNSDYINDVEIQQAMKRHEKGEVILIPIFLRFCELEGHVLLDFQGLPACDNPISKWPDKDEAWTMIVKKLKVHIKNFQKKKLN